jgi:hypothetical protein
MQPDKIVKKIVAHLDVLRFPTSHNNIDGTCCLNCSWQLSLSQPDSELPDRLIGVCERCKHWFLIDLIPESGEGIMSKLPESQVIRNLSHGNQTVGISVMSHEADQKQIRSQGQENKPNTMS